MISSGSYSGLSSWLARRWFRYWKPSFHYLYLLQCLHLLTTGLCSFLPCYHPFDIYASCPPRSVSWPAWYNKSRYLRTNTICFASPRQDVPREGHLQPYTTHSAPLPGARVKAIRKATRISHPILVGLLHCKKLDGNSASYLLHDVESLLQLRSLTLSLPCFCPCLRVKEPCVSRDSGKET